MPLDSYPQQHIVQFFCPITKKYPVHTINDEHNGQNNDEEIDNPL